MPLSSQTVASVEKMLEIKSYQFYLTVIEIKSDSDLHETFSDICSSVCEKLVVALNENVFGNV